MGRTKDLFERKMSKRVTWAKFNLSSIFLLVVSFLFLFCCSIEQLALRHQQPKTKTPNKYYKDFCHLCFCHSLAITASSFHSLYISALNDTHTNPSAAFTSREPPKPAFLHHSVLPLLESQCPIPPSSRPVTPPSECRVSGKSVLGV